MKYIFEELYTKKENTDGSVTYVPFDVNSAIDKMTICGKTIPQVIQIISGLNIEKMTDIEMTMKNLSYLFDKVMEEQNQHMQYQINEMIHSWIDNKGIEEK